jgi:outer membrane protein assembly factor BamD (BamD/ComL family)
VLWKLWITGILKKYLLLILTKALIISIAAQPSPEKKELADEYVKRENHAKALEIYEDLAGDENMDGLIFDNYLICIEKLKPGKAEGLIRKFQKRHPSEFRYQTALYLHYLNSKKDPAAAENYIREKLNPWLLKSESRTRLGYQFFMEQEKTAYASSLLESAVRTFGLGQFWREIFVLQFKEKKYPELTATVLRLLDEKTTEMTEMQAYLQEPIQNQDLSNILQAELLKKIQVRPNEILYPEMLAWIYLQNKDFEGALVQNKALDKLQNTGGTRTYQLGEYAVNNEQIKVAIKCFDFIIRDFPASQYRFLAQQKIILLQENLVKNTYPIVKEDVRKLIADYRLLSQSQFLNYFELSMKVAELYGKYLNRPDSAIQILENSFASRGWPAVFKNRAKILLADMYILKDEPWEASLLYGQVEKDEVETLTGYEAKLKNAKVFYYKGEFELCEEQLDVLKMGTSRDISNDAIELSLLIQDIMAEDTTGYFLGKFADIDLLTFQGNYQASTDEIEKLTMTVSNAVVLEKLKYRLFKNFEATRQFPKALEVLDQIYKTKATDLYLDDALYFSGVIQAENLKNKEKSMEFFLQLIKEIPGSVFVADARKRLRILRGDALN